MGGSASRHSANHVSDARVRLLGTAVGGLLVSLVTVRWLTNKRQANKRCVEQGEGAGKASRPGQQRQRQQGQQRPQPWQGQRQGLDDITGVSLSVLVDLTHPEFRHGMTTSEVCTAIVEPATARHQCSYADLLRHNRNNNHLNVPGKVHQRANVFVSHAWSYPFQAVVDTLEEYLEHHKDELDAEHTYFWFDMLVKNQHIPAVIDTNQLKTVFQLSLRRIGRVVAVFTPWDKPTYVTRIWCLWEVLCAVESGCKYDIFMPPNDHASFIRALVFDFDSIMRALCKVDVAHAQAREEADRVAILEAVAQSDGGVAGINARVVGCINSWLARTAQAELERREREQEGGGVADQGEMAALLNNMGMLFRQQGHYARALPLYERALGIDETVLGPNHLDVAKTLGNLANLHQAQGDFARALPLYQRALEIKENALGPNHPHVAATLNNLAAMHKAKGNFARALPLYERALEIVERTLGPNHPQVAITLNNLASSHKDQGNVARALSLYERSLKIVEKALGPNHPDVAITLNNLANVHKTQGNFARALPLYERALEIKEKTLGPSHPEVAKTLNHLGDLHQAQGNFARALPLYERALEIKEKALGPNHPQVAITLNNLAAVHSNRGNPALARLLLERALQILQSALGPAHPHTQNVRASLRDLA